MQALPVIRVFLKSGICQKASAYNCTDDGTLCRAGMPRTVKEHGAVGGGANARIQVDLLGRERPAHVLVVALHAVQCIRICRAQRHALPVALHLLAQPHMHMFTRLRRLFKLLSTALHLLG